MSEYYRLSYRTKAQEVAEKQNINLKEGIYMGFSTLPTKRQLKFVLHELPEQTLWECQQCQRSSLHVTVA